jgi:hypothetical protein
MSAQIWPGRNTSATRPSPNNTSRTSAEVGRQLITMSLSRASACALCVGTAPASAKRATTSGRRSKTRILCSRNSRRANAPPILPNPI